MMKAYKAILVAILVFVLALLSSDMAVAGSNALKEVKVGIVEQEGYAMRDENGVIRGRDAEYLARIAECALLKLDYNVYDSFDALLYALERGEVDMVPGISRNEEREAKFLFSEREMANGYVAIKVYSDDDQYEYNDLTQIDGMTLGYVSGSSGGAAVKSWAEDMGLHVELAAFDSEQELRDSLLKKTVDGVISTGRLMTDCRTILSIKIQSYYAAFNNRQNDLKLLVDSAMNQILEESPLFAANLYYNQEKNKQKANIVLSAKQKEYLEAHTSDPVRIAVIENDPPYNLTKNGECRGIVRDYYDRTAALLNDQVPGFSVSYISYPDFETAIEAVAGGEADILGMVRLSAVEASRYDLILTGSLDTINIMQVSLADNDISGPNSVSKKRAAVLGSDYETLKFVMGPDWENYEFQTTEFLSEARQRLETGKTDLIFVSSPQAAWILNQRRAGNYYLSTLPHTGWELKAAVNTDNAVLGTIITKTAGSQEIDISTIISDNTMTEPGLWTYLQRLPVIYFIVFFGIILLILFLIFSLVIYSIRLKARQRQDDMLIKGQAELLHAYEYDAVTGLANRDTAIRWANDNVKADDRFCVVIMNVINLGFVNESFGYKQGDKVILDISGRLQEFVKEDPERRYLCRYKGKSFLFLLRGAGLDEAKAVVEKLSDIARKEIDLGVMDESLADGTSVRPHISFGIAESDGTSSPEQVIRNCAIAANAAGEDGTETVRVYEKDLAEKKSRQNEVREELIRALEQDDFMMVYQPKIDLRTGKMAGSEALVRIKGNRFSPGEFIPVAENSGYIQRIGRLVARLVVNQLAEWKRQGLSLQPVSINYSSNQLGDVQFVDYLLQLLEENEISPSLIEIEVTETLLLKQGTVSDELFRRLKAAGIRLLLDDFGSGYSSLHYLSFIPVDVIKLDKSIVDDYLVEDSGKAGKSEFVGDLIRLLRNLGKEIIIEGIEESWQVKKMVEYGCDMIQGYYFSPPISPEKLSVYTLTDEQRQTVFGERMPGANENKN